jgi:hypothetical protein
MTAPSPASMPVPREVRPDQLAVTYPAFAITCQPRGWRGVQWEAIRKNGAEPGLYAVITADLAELGAVLAAAAGPGGAGSHGGPGVAS